MKLLLPLVLVLVGLGAGVGAGFWFRPEGEAPVVVQADLGANDFLRMSNQFVVPIVAEGRVRAMVVLSLSLETRPGNSEEVFAREPRLRDTFLQTLFDHANMGGFEGNFTQSGSMTLLRSALRETGQEVLGDILQDVLILDIVRQDT